MRGISRWRGLIPAGLPSVAGGSLWVVVALVTGAAVGIGRAIALALLAAGMDTWLADVQEPEGPEGRFVRLDVTDDAALRRVIVEARPDVVVNNAGGIPAGRSDVEILDLNLRSALVATELAVEHGARAIVNIASVAGLETIPHRSPAYAAAKAGLIRFTTAYDGPARVNCIVPGWIATPRGLREAAAMTEPERAVAGPMVAMDTITAAVSDLLAGETARGRVVVLR
jgi:NAD(P)-dependent dehydrogenase (short-subunit alcohol dehydrogenase family)